MVTVGGAFMAVAALEPSKTPRPVWANGWFDLGFAFVILGLLIAAIGLFLHFRRERPPSPAGKPAVPAEIPGTPAAPLVVKIKGEPRWEAWRHIVLLLAANTEVTNTTDGPILVAGYGFTYDAPGGQLWQVGLDGEAVHAIDREVYARQNDVPYRYGAPLQAREIPAHATVSGWRVWAVTRQARGGTPRCTVVVTDDVGNQYTAVIPAQKPRRVYPSSSA
jgi:hypothetical protein